MPSKTLLAAAEIAARTRHHDFAGVPTSVGPIDLGALVVQKNELVDGLRQAKYADPAIPGIESIDYLTSTTAMELTDLPASLIVIGAGFVGDAVAWRLVPSWSCRDASPNELTPGRAGIDVELGGDRYKRHSRCV